VDSSFGALDAFAFVMFAVLIFVGVVIVVSLGAKEATLTINKQTVKIAAGAGGPQSPKGPMLDLPPGTYQYALRLPGQPARNETLTVAAGDAWGLLVGPSGNVLPLQMY
jgi:hypothetical protein